MFVVAEADHEPLLKLADEYDVIHIKRKCQHFIGSQLQFTLTIDQVLKYLWLCQLYQLNEQRDNVLALAADHPLEPLRACQYYSLLESSSRADLMEMRCRLLEDEKDPKKCLLSETGRFLRKVRSAVNRIPALVLMLTDKCSDPCEPSRPSLFFFFILFFLFFYLLYSAPSSGIY